MYKTTMFLYQTPALYALDKMAVELDGLPEIELMQRAGTRVWQVINARWGRDVDTMTVFVGCGNNGGDGLVICRLLNEVGYMVSLFCVGNTDSGSRDFKINFDYIQNYDIPQTNIDENNAGQFSRLTDSESGCF